MSVWIRLFRPCRKDYNEEAFLNSVGSIEWVPPPSRRCFRLPPLYLLSMVAQPTGSPLIIDWLIYQHQFKWMPLLPLQDLLPGSTTFQRTSEIGVLQAKNIHGVVRVLQKAFIQGFHIHTLLHFGDINMDLHLGSSDAGRQGCFPPRHWDAGLPADA